MGDLNFKNIDWNLMTDTSQTMNKEYFLVETVKDIFYAQHVDPPTRGRGTDTLSLLDLVLTDGANTEPDIN